MINNQTTDLALIEHYIAHRVLRTTLIKALSTKKPLLAILRSKFGDKVASVLKQEATNILPKKPRIFGSMTEHEIVDRLSAQHNVKEKKVLMGMLNQLTLEIEKFPTRQQSATVRLVNDKVIVAGRHEMTQQDPLTIM